MSRVRRAVIAAGLVLCGAVSAIAEPLPVSATLVTVHLFSVREVQKITVKPGGGGWMRSCAQCPKQPVVAAMQFENRVDGVRLVSGGTVKRIELSGNFAVSAGGLEQEVNAAGLWTITATGTGLRVLLSLSSERYVVAALSGEAAPDEPLESLKAMAVSMRTFALVNANRHVAEGFGLCDSTHCQALKFGRVRPEIERAVRETAGETLWSGSRRAKIYYTQHCGGVTEAASNVWPDAQAAYLSSHQDPYCVRRSSASWVAQMRLDQISAIFRHEGWRTPAALDDVRIVKRTLSGRVRLLEVSGSGTHASISASSLRFAVDRALGWNQLRSDWYSVKVVQGILHFEGKGYGHGVGLCQAGAYEMAAEGHDSREILNFYFPGTVTRVGVSDSGWKSYEGRGLTLLSVAPDAELLAQADRAWARAKAAFPVSASLHPRISILPTTELFRQTTGEPGWVLAATRESDVYMQPSAIIQKNSRSEKVLLHEFLHVLVEREAASQTPLWLREGLVEALASEDYGRHGAAVKMSIVEVGAGLGHPADAVAAQRAHTAAGQMAERLVKRYGIVTVRGWLRNGIPTEAVERLALKD